MAAVTENTSEQSQSEIEAQDFGFGVAMSPKYARCTFQLVYLPRSKPTRNCLNTQKC